MDLFDLRSTAARGALMPDVRGLSSVRGGGAAAPVPANNQFVMFGDSRTDMGALGYPYQPTAGTVISGPSSNGLFSQLMIATGGRLVCRPELSNFGISGASFPDALAVPRTPPGGATAPRNNSTYSALLGMDVVAAHPAATVIFLLGTNAIASQDLSVGSANWNSIFAALQSWSSKFRVYVLNELPRGKNSAGSTASNLTGAGLTAMVNYQQSLKRFDRKSGDATYSLPNVVVIDSFSSILDPATGAGGTGTYYNIVGTLSDGLHLSGEGAAKIVSDSQTAYDGKSWVQQILDDYPAAQRDANASRMPTSTTGVMNTNPLATGTNGTVVAASGGFANYPSNSSVANVPTSWRIDSQTGCSDITLTISKGVDDQGFACLVVQWSRTSGGVATAFTIREAITSAQAQAAFNLGDKFRFQSRVKLVSPVGVRRLSGTARIQTATAYISEIAVGQDATPASPLTKYVPAFDWTTWEGRDVDTTGYITDETTIASNTTLVQMEVKLEAGATSGAIYISRLALRLNAPN